MPTPRVSKHALRSDTGGRHQTSTKVFSRQIKNLFKSCFLFFFSLSLADTRHECRDLTRGEMTVLSAIAGQPRSLGRPRFRLWREIMHESRTRFVFLMRCTHDFFFQVSKHRNQSHLHRERMLQAVCFLSLAAKSAGGNKLRCPFVVPLPKVFGKHVQSVEGHLNSLSFTSFFQTQILRACRHPSLPPHTTQPHAHVHAAKHVHHQ